MAIEELKKDTVIIFISGLNLHKTPQVVQDAIASDEAAGPTPIVAVCDSSVETLIGVIPYFNMKDVNGFTGIRKALGEYRGIPYQPTESRYQLENWKDRRGRGITATYVTSASGIVTLRLQNGKLSTMAIANLSESGRKRVEELSGGQ